MYSSDGSGIIRLAREIFVCVRWSKGRKCELYCMVECVYGACGPLSLALTWIQL